MFSALVKHEMKWRSKNDRQNQRRGLGFVYIAVLLAVGLYFWTKLAIAVNIEPNLNWNIGLGLPFAIYGISAGAMSREWKNNTIGWWLSLPYSRFTLILAKFIAGLWRTLYIFLAMTVLAIIAYLYAMIFDPQLNFHGLIQFLMAGINIALVLVVLGPLMVSLGMITAVLARNGYQYVIPLFWIVFWIAWSIVISDHIKQFFGGVKAHDFSLVIPSLVALVPCWLIAYGILRVTARFLEKNLNL